MEDDTVVRLPRPGASVADEPRYAEQAVDQQFARWVMLHVQSNPRGERRVHRVWNTVIRSGAP